MKRTRRLRTVLVKCEHHDIVGTGPSRRVAKREAMKGRRLFIEAMQDFYRQVSLTEAVLIRLRDQGSQVVKDYPAIIDYVASLKTWKFGTRRMALPESAELGLRKPKLFFHNWEKMVLSKVFELIAKENLGKSIAAGGRSTVEFDMDGLILINSMEFWSELDGFEAGLRWLMQIHKETHPTKIFKESRFSPNVRVNIIDESSKITAAGSFDKLPYVEEVNPDNRPI